MHASTLSQSSLFEESIELGIHALAKLHCPLCRDLVAKTIAFASAGNQSRCI